MLLIGLAVLVGVIALVIGFAVAMHFMPDPWSDPPLPSDRQLVTRFTAHRTQFERLRQLWLSDPTLNTDPSASKSLGRLQALMDELGVYDITSGDYATFATSDSGMVVITMAARGLVNAGSEKGYVWAAKRPSPLVANTGDRAGSALQGARFHHLQGDWYVYYGWND